MHTRGLPGLVLLLVVVAGCFDEPTAPAAVLPPGPSISDAPQRLVEQAAQRTLHALKEILPFSVLTPDGVVLRGHVYVPDAPGPLSTILEYSPYFNQVDDPSDGRETTAEDGRRTMSGDHRELLEAGFAVALVNLRGTGTSGNCVHWGAQQDLDDVYLVVETLASQAWSDGNVGMVGTSYPGWTQFMALAAAPPSLKAVIPVSGVVDLYSILGRNGATLSIGPVATTQWHALYSIGEATYPPLDSRGGEVNRGDCPDRVLEDLRESAMLYGEGDRNAYWDARDLRPRLREGPDVPILYTNGLTDGEGHIVGMEGVWDILPSQDKRLMLGQWGHGGNDHPTMDWAQMRVAWFDHYLRGAPMIVEPGIVDYQDADGDWHVADQWPPASTPTTLFLSGTNGLVPESGKVAPGEQTFQSVHTNPCPGVCTSSIAGETPVLPLAQCQGAQALFVSPPLKEDVLLAGNFHVNLTLSSTLPNGHLAAYLYRTTGDGTCGDTDVREVRRALASLRHAQTPGQHDGEDFPIGTPTGVNLPSHPFASPVKAGERLVVAIGGGSLELTPEVRKPALTVTTGQGVLGQVTLPVVEGALRF